MRAFGSHIFFYAGEGNDRVIDSIIVTEKMSFTFCLIFYHLLKASPEIQLEWQ